MEDEEGVTVSEFLDYTLGSETVNKVIQRMNEVLDLSVKEKFPTEKTSRYSSGDIAEILRKNGIVE